MEIDPYIIIYPYAVGYVPWDPVIDSYMLLNRYYRWNYSIFIYYRLIKNPWIYYYSFGGFLKWGYPQIIQFNRIVPKRNHPASLGYPQFRELPFIISLINPMPLKPSLILPILWLGFLPSPCAASCWWQPGAHLIPPVHSSSIVTSLLLTFINQSLSNHQPCFLTSINHDQPVLDRYIHHYQPIKVTLFNHFKPIINHV